MKKIIVNYLLSKQWFISIVIQRFVDDIDRIDYNAHAEGCGLEDRNIQDRYEAMEFGWENAIEAAIEAVENAV